MLQVLFVDNLVSSSKTRACQCAYCKSIDKETTVLDKAVPEATGASLESSNLYIY